MCPPRPPVSIIGFTLEFTPKNKLHPFSNSRAGERIKIKNYANPQILRIDAEKSLQKTQRNSNL
jgi:hypothetical protein